MNKNSFLILFTFFIFDCSSVKINSSNFRDIASSNQQCSEIVEVFLKDQNEISIIKDDFDKLYNSLNETMTGNLSTVFRSEWKAKESFKRASEYLLELIQSFSSRRDIPIIVKNEEDRYLDDIATYLNEFKKIDRLTMRDPLSPPGTNDRTFTYYTKSLNVPSNEGKHQVRVRRYVRTLDLNKMEFDRPVMGFLDGQLIKIEKKSGNQFSYIRADGIDHESLVLHNAQEEVITEEKLQNILGNPPMFYPYPHAKAYKLEVKSKSSTEIIDSGYKNLNGKNYVQKLSVNIDEKQMNAIFGQKYTKGEFEQVLREVTLELEENPKNTKERIKAILDVLRYGQQKDSSFNIFRGATEYERNAFEIEVPDEIDGKLVKIQTTFDQKMGTRSVYNKVGSILSPVSALRSQKVLRPANVEENVHFELKVPKVLVERIQTGETSHVLKKVLSIFNSYNVTNKGKFNHILKRKK